MKKVRGATTITYNIHTSNTPQNVTKFPLARMKTENPTPYASIKSCHKALTHDPEHVAVVRPFVEP